MVARNKAQKDFFAKFELSPPDFVYSVDFEVKGYNLNNMVGKVVKLRNDEKRY